MASSYEERLLLQSRASKALKELNSEACNAMNGSNFQSAYLALKMSTDTLRELSHNSAFDAVSHNVLAATTLNNWGIYALRGESRPDVALIFFMDAVRREADARRVNVDSVSVSNSAQTIMNVGVVMSKLGNHTLSAQFARRAIGMLLTCPSAALLKTVDTASNNGETSESIAKGESISNIDVSGRDQRFQVLLSIALFNLAAEYEHEGLLKESLSVYRKAIAFCGAQKTKGSEAMSTSLMQAHDDVRNILLKQNEKKAFENVWGSVNGVALGNAQSVVVGSVTLSDIAEHALGAEHPEPVIIFPSVNKKTNDANSSGNLSRSRTQIRSISASSKMKASKSLEAALSFADNTNVVEMTRGKTLTDAAEILANLSLPGKELLLSREYKPPPPRPPSNHHILSPGFSMSLSLDASDSIIPESKIFNQTSLNMPVLNFPPHSSSSPPQERPEWTNNIGIDKAAEIKAFQKDTAASRLDFRPSKSPSEKRKLMVAERSMSEIASPRSLFYTSSTRSKNEHRSVTSPVGQSRPSLLKTNEESPLKPTDEKESHPRPGTAVLQPNGLLSIYGEQKAWHHQPPLEPVYPHGSAEEAAALALKHPASVPRLVRANTPNRRSKFKTDKGAVPPMYAPYVLVKPGTFSAKKPPSVNSATGSSVSGQATGISSPSNPLRTAYYDSSDDGDETESVIHMNDVVSKAILRIEMEVAMRKEAAEAAKEEARVKAARMKRLAAERAAKAEGRTLPTEEEEAKAAAEAAEKLAVERANIFTASTVPSSSSFGSVTDRSQVSQIESVNIVVPVDTIPVVQKVVVKPIPQIVDQRHFASESESVPAAQVEAESVPALQTEAESAVLESVPAVQVEAESVVLETIPSAQAEAESAPAVRVEAESVLAVQVEAESVPAAQVEAESVVLETIPSAQAEAESAPAVRVEAASVPAVQTEAESAVLESVPAVQVEADASVIV
jgi:tetratricopeptide (TPR) repeat protein